jgi:hypothetical protein
MVIGRDSHSTDCQYDAKDTNETTPQTLLEELILLHEHTSPVSPFDGSLHIKLARCSDHSMAACFGLGSDGAVGDENTVR